jgi:hypothetical protein
VRIVQLSAPPVWHFRLGSSEVTVLSPLGARADPAKSFACNAVLPLKGVPNWSKTTPRRLNRLPPSERLETRV